MAAYYVNPEPGPERRPSRSPPIPGADEAIAVVAFVPWRCPSCGDTKPRTYGRQGVVRYHECECGLKFRSIELPQDELIEVVRKYI
jgi:hypothetical protein